MNRRFATVVCCTFVVFGAVGLATLVAGTDWALPPALAQNEDFTVPEDNQQQDATVTQPDENNSDDTSQDDRGREAGRAAERPEGLAGTGVDLPLFAAIGIALLGSGLLLRRVVAR